MKFLKIFEKFKQLEDWKIGDIVYTPEEFYIGKGRWARDDTPYEIMEIKEIYIKIKYLDADEILPFANIYNFITEEEWKLNQSTKKYNL